MTQSLRSFVRNSYGALVILEGAQRPKDLFNEEWAGNREGGRDPSLDAQDDSRR
ncbi:MAG: hypothetical protein ABI718_12705 [Acidobacteriota bacterium]